MTDSQDEFLHPGAFCSVPGATGKFKSGRDGICSARNDGDRLRWRASGPPPARKPRRTARTPLGLVMPDQQILPVTVAVSHHTRVDAVTGEQAFTITCTCGQSRNVRYARPTGQPVAQRLAAIYGSRHEEDPAANPLTEDTPPILIVEDEAVQVLGGADRQVHLRALPAQKNTAGPASQDNPTGWSAAARRRAARRFGRGGGSSSPLGQRVSGGRGYTQYEDTEFGGGSTQIWDKS